MTDMNQPSRASGGQCQRSEGGLELLRNDSRAGARPVLDLSLEPAHMPFWRSLRVNRGACAG